MNILEDLWYGNLCPIEQDSYRTKEFKHLVLLYQKSEDNFLATISDTQKELLRKMQDLEGEMRSIAECSAFISGFRLAMQLVSASVGTES